MLPQEIIRAKRDGKTLTQEQIAFFVQGITTGEVTDGQVAAFAMAIWFNGMSMPERVALTEHMMHSGSVLDWSRADLPGPVVDKHSTGGVSDSVSLMLGPMVAACGGYVPMISGRGLGHTGGTLDKFESIPGYQTAPDEAKLRAVVRETGVAIIGQTADLAPADKRFYGIRDVTATVDSIPLITASILSKKLAAGLGALAMDVKAGNGAFMTNPEDAGELAQSIVTVANEAGVRTSATITDMNQPLGSTAGNAVEVMEAIQYLRGDYRNPRLHEVTMALCSQMLQLTGLAESDFTARQKLTRALDSGAAAERFGQMVNALGGPTDFMEKPDQHLPTAPVQQPVYADQGGFISQVASRDVGLAVVSLGGGRTDPAASVDHAVGLTNLQPIGAAVDDQTPLAMVHAQTEDQARAAAATLKKAITVSDKKPADPQLIYATLEP